MRRKSPVVLIVSIIVGLLVLCCAGVFGLGFWGIKKMGGMIGCAVNFEIVRDSVVAYAGDHNGKFPAAATWQDDVAPYVSREIQSQKLNNQPIFKTLDPNGTWACEENGISTGICYNSELAGKTIDSIKDPYGTVLVYEVPAASRNNNAPYKHPSGPGPRFMNTNRQWIVEHIRGESSNNGFTFDDRSSSSSDSSKDDSDTPSSSKSDDDDESKPSKPSTPKAPKPDPNTPGEGG